MPPPGVVIGSTVLLHAIYSSYEYVSASKMTGLVSDKTLPKDIVVQIIMGLILILLSTISSAIGKMDPIKVSNKNIQDVLRGEDKYAYLETRPNFQDLISKRKQYLEWRKSQDTTEATNTVENEKKSS